MSFDPRHYQLESVESVFTYFQNNSGNPVIALPTGTGKSVVLALLLQKIFQLYPGQRIVVLSHVAKLIDQDYGKLIAIWPQAPAGVYAAKLEKKYGRSLNNPITFGTIDSIYTLSEQVGKVDLVLIDEAHLVKPKEGSMYNSFLSNLVVINPKLKIIGLTATPWQVGIGNLSDNGIFTDVCIDYTSYEKFNSIIEDGYLCKLIPKRTNLIINTEDLSVRAGEYVNAELEKVVNIETVTRGALEESIKIAIADRRYHWLVFAVSIKHAENITRILNEMGVKSACIHSKMKDSAIEAIIELHESGEITALINVDMLTTGYDSPIIDMIIVLRPTYSTILWVQMLGRGTRPHYAKGYDLDLKEGRLAAIANSHKPNCLVLDFAKNTKRLGPINDPRVPQKKGKGNRTDAPVKICEHCNTYNPASIRFCIDCGKEFSFQIKIEEKAGTEELIRYEAPEIIEFEVTHATYSVHKKQGKPDSVRVTYYCHLRMFSEYICFEHGPFFRSKAERWWRKRSIVPQIPASTKEAVAMSDNLRVPSSIKVWINKDYPEITDFIFT